MICCAVDSQLSRWPSANVEGLRHTAKQEPDESSEITQFSNAFFAASRLRVSLLLNGQFRTATRCVIASQWPPNARGTSPLPRKSQKT